MTDSTRTIALALPYSVSIRDLVNSGALQELLNAPNIHVLVYTLNPSLPELSGLDAEKVTIRVLTPYRDGWLERLVKRAYPLFFADKLGHVQISLRHRCAASAVAALCVRIRNIIGTRRLIRVIASALLRLYAWRGGTQFLDRGLCLFVGTRSLINSLDYGLLAEATLKGIPILTIAGSWDNFTTKGFFPFPSKRTVVWNEKMREELTNLFGVVTDTVTLAGYPRALLLRGSILNIASEDYLRSLGIHGYRRFILYCASYSNLTQVPGRPSPLEYELIKNISEKLIQILPKDVCILIRLHPFSGELDKQFFADMASCFVYVPGRADAYVERVMNQSDESHLATQIAKSACVISMASTMSIDVLCLGRPVLNVDFDPFEGLPDSQSVRRFYHFTHFRDLVAATRLPLARDFDEILTFVMSSLKGDYCSPVDFDALERLYVPHDSDLYPKIIRSTVEELIGE